MSLFTSRLTEQREIKEWTKADAARKLGTGYTTYCNWEYGIAEPSLEMLSKIADAFDVSADYLIGRTDNPKPAKKKQDKTFVVLQGSSFQLVTDEKGSVILNDKQIKAVRLIVKDQMRISKEQERKDAEKVKQSIADSLKKLTDDYGID